MFFEAAGPPQPHRTFLSISSDGQKQTIYELPEDVLDEVDNTYFYAARDGQFYLLIKPPGGSLRLFTYDEDGKLKSRLALDAPKDVLLESFAVNSEGFVAVMAYHTGADARKTRQAASYRAIFNPAGSPVSTLPTANTKV